MDGKNHIPTALQRAQESLMAEMQAAAGGGQPPQVPAGATPTGEPSPESAVELVPLPAEPGAAQPAGAPPMEVDAQGLTAEQFGTPGAGRATPGAANAEPAAGGDGAAWKQRYDVLQGKYDAEVPRLQASVRLLESLLQRLQTAAPAPPAGAPAPGEAPADGAAAAETLDDTALKELVGDQQVLDEFGPEFFRTMARFTRKLSPRPAERSAETEALKAELAQARVARLEAGLDRALPNWRRQDSDPRFVEWINGTREPRTGVPYVEVLRGAMDRGDLQGVAAVFRDWPGGQAATVPGQAPRVPVAEQVTVRPAGGAGASPRSEPAKRTYTQDQVMAAAKKIATGEIGGQRAQALQAELDAAIREGRVR